jgi:hypothetical protein
VSVFENDDGKRMVEEEHVAKFLAAYEVVTGTILSVVSAGESPDFICVRESGETVGVELARSPHNREQAVYDRIWTDRTISAFDLLAAVWGMISDKARKRQLPHWRTPKTTILVIELLDYGFDSLDWANDASLADDFADTGFLEIWISDHSTIEAYGQVRLIGLFPPELYGLRHQPALEGKPFG